MSDAPIINFVSVSAGAVHATYVNLPSGAKVVFVNRTSNATFGGGVAASGQGSLTMAVPAGMPSGEYYLKAQDSKGAFLAQSVVFYI